MTIALDTPTISFSSLAFSFETPGEMSTPVGEGHEPRIVGIDVRAEREDDYGATMSIEAGGGVKTRKAGSSELARGLPSGRIPDPLSRARNDARGRLYGQTVVSIVFKVRFSVAGGFTHSQLKFRRKLSP